MSRRKRSYQNTKKSQTNESNDIDDEWKNATSIYNFKVKTLHGEEVSLDKYQGHVCIIVNVASKCGYTKVNYDQLNELYEKYGDSKGLKILAFPCNQFGGQEPHNADKIQEFLNKRNVKFDVFEKIFVNGVNSHPLFKYLKEQISDVKSKDIKWNFTKFIINDDGIPVERFPSSRKPMLMLESLQKLW